MFKLIKTEGRARRGELKTVHGSIQTPVFMNVGTQAAIKGGLSSFDLKDVGCQVELSNAYHLHLRPGDEVIKRLGGLHKFMNWGGPILTDSGGFQVFSLAKLRRVRKEGVYFQSHIDGRRIFMGPKESMTIQSNLGSTIAMAFDECVESTASYEYIKESCGLTVRWLEICKEKLNSLNNSGHAINPHQLLFGINQGGIWHDLRIENMKRIREFDLPGYAIGGLAVGETADEMYGVIESVEPHMPKDRPRYLMGVGTPVNIIEAVSRGIDFFDCVLPARNARHGHIFTWSGIVNMNNAKHREDDDPIDPLCGCSVCKNFSRAYLHHLFKAGEILALRLSVIHNLYFYNKLMERIREEIERDNFLKFKAANIESLGLRI